MSESVMFVDSEKKATVRSWFDKFREKAPVGVEERDVDTSFGRTHALLAGPADAPPLVLLHGAMATSAHALPELGPLLESRRVAVLDVVGQSVMSEDRRVDLADDSYGKWVGEATKALGIDRFDLYGVSWGGFVAMRAANLLGDRIKKLVLLVPAGLVSGSAWDGFVKMGWPMMMFKAFPNEVRLQRLVDGLCTTNDPDWTSYFGDAFRCYRMDMRIPPLAKPEQVSNIKCPVLVFGAEHDVSFPGARLIARVNELLPHAEVELLEGSKHCPPTTDSFRTKMAKRIEAFLG
ncbi:MAG: alpha/beta hydrolase [Polyangiaceae bacterium]|nr:alpha/beta hydrolase [Polyangiaceae bacterium]